MPRHTQRIKVDAVRALGAKTILTGETFDDAYAAARALARAENAIFVPPFDDKGVIAGNATIAAEILRQHPGPLAAIFCAVGGGGLAAGVAAYVKAVRPEIKVIGVESADSAGLSASLAAGKIVTLPTVGFSPTRWRCGESAICLSPSRANVWTKSWSSTTTRSAPRLWTFTTTRAPSSSRRGRWRRPGLKRWAQGRRIKTARWRRLPAGANMNFDRLRFVAERAELGEQREGAFWGDNPRKAGQFSPFLQVAGAAANHGI